MAKKWRLQCGWWVGGIFTLGAFVSISGCASRLVVDSEPADARVLWSPDGVDDWRPWPPKTWEGQPTVSLAEGVTTPSVQTMTPLSDTSSYSDSFWVTVDKEGFYRPRPQLVQLYAGHTERLSFVLEETREAEEKRLLQSGFVLYKGEYVKPEDLGLVQVEGIWFSAEEAQELQQRSAGKVLYNGVWMTPEERLAQYNQEQSAKGFVPFKQRWVKPSVLAFEEEIDQDVAELKNNKTVRPLREPRVVGSVQGDVAQLQVHNSSRLPLTLLLSGPRSQRLSLNAYETYGAGEAERFTILAGEYSLATLPLLDSDKDTTESLNSTALIDFEFKPGIKYLVTYEEEGASTAGQLSEYTRSTPEIPSELPTIQIPEVKLPEAPQRPGGAPGGGGGRGGGRGGGGGGPRR
ncbi:MAG: hypothetical protein SFY68_13400 [Candidatus Sumerlaeia bacterium]|nr:hypothetical protein [Candidatus Sumerlaeia bacterium]